MSLGGIQEGQLWVQRNQWSPLNFASCLRHRAHTEPQFKRNHTPIRCFLFTWANLASSLQHLLNTATDGNLSLVFLPALLMANSGLAFLILWTGGLSGIHTQFPAFLQDLYSLRESRQYHSDLHCLEEHSKPSESLSLYRVVGLKPKETQLLWSSPVSF